MSKQAQIAARRSNGRGVARDRRLRFPPNATERGVSPAGQMARRLVEFSGRGGGV